MDPCSTSDSEGAQSHEVVGGESEGELEVDLGEAPVLEFAHVSDGLGPAEAFLAPFPDALAHRVTTVTGGTPVNRGTPVGVVPRHMRTDVDAAQPLHKGSGIVSLVRPEREPIGAGARRHHRQARLALGPSVGFGGTGIDDQSMAVIHQRMA